MAHPREYAGQLLGREYRIGIVVARTNDRLTERLLAGALDALARHDVAPEAIAVARVPGAWEIPFGLRALARRERFDALVALGALIRGETAHFDFLARACASGVAEASRELGIPVAFGVLTCEDSRQADERSGGKAGNKGAEAALAALEMADLAAVLSPEADGGDLSS